MVNVSNAKQVINLFVHNPAQRLIQKPKVVQMAVEDLSKLKYAPACDTFVSNTPKLTSKIAPLKSSKGLARLEDGTPVCRYEYSFRTPKYEFENDTYPISWIDSQTGIAKDSLYVDYMNTRCAATEHKGFGREMMKRFYLQSLEAGCEGRISLEAAWGSGGFYKKLGFEVGERDLKFYKDVIKECREFLDELFIQKQNGKNIAEIDGCKFEVDRTIESVKKDIEKWTKRMNNPIKTSSSGGSQHLFFTPTPENVAKLFCK